MSEIPPVLRDTTAGLVSESFSIIGASALWNLPEEELPPRARRSDSITGEKTEFEESLSYSSLASSSVCCSMSYCGDSTDSVFEGTY